MKLIKFASAILLFFGLADLTRSTETEAGKKKFGEKCKRRVFGSECAKGLECSKQIGICLKLNKQSCTNNADCISKKCVDGRCQK